MAEPTVTEEETTQAQTEENQTVTAEQFEVLKEEYEASKKMFEELKKAQSGSDATVTRLQKELLQKEKERETEKLTNEQRNAQAIAELKEAIEQERAEKVHAVNKSLATQMLIDADLPVPRLIERLIGNTEEETLGFVKLYIEDRQDDKAAGKDKEAKKYGRKIVDTTQKSQEKMSYADMQALSDEQFKEIPTELVNKAMDAALGAKA